MKEYVELTLQDLNELNRYKTVFLMSISPIEVHGNHLPLGTDVFISEAIIERYRCALQTEFPDLTLVKLPPLYLGADALPVKGSLSITSKYLRKIILNLVKGLASQGFRYMFLANNHGGPRHQLALEAASRYAWNKYQFYLIDSFGLEYRRMVLHHQDLLKKTGLQPGNCGDHFDAHAGTNETSLMLACCPQKVNKNIDKIAKSTPPSPSRLLLGFARSLKIFGLIFSKELIHLIQLMTWVKSSQTHTYLGSPGLATSQSGEAMLNYRVSIAMGLFRQALKGEEVKTTPLLWFLRFLTYIS